MRSDKEIQRIREGMQDRARYFFCLYQSFSKALPPKDAEKLAREAITEYGRIRAERDSKNLTPEEWVDIHLSQMGGVFESKIEKNDNYCEIRMHYCPHLEEWKQLKASHQELDLLCDIAMELDRGRAASHGIKCEIRERMAKGDRFCRVVLHKNK